MINVLVRLVKHETELKFRMNELKCSRPISSISSNGTLVKKKNCPTFFFLYYRAGYYFKMLNLTIAYSLTGWRTTNKKYSVKDDSLFTLSYKKKKNRGTCSKLNHKYLMVNDCE